MLRLRSHQSVQPTSRNKTIIILTAFLKGFSSFNAADPSPPASSETVFAAGDGREDDDDDGDDDDDDDGVGVSCQTRMAAITPAVQTAVMRAVRRILSQPGEGRFVATIVASLLAFTYHTMLVWPLLGCAVSRTCHLTLSCFTIHHTRIVCQV